MTQEACDEFVQKIKQHFDYLFTEHGFLVVWSASDRSGEKCLVVLESPACRLKFYYDRGMVETLIGTSSAPIEWSDSCAGTRHWFQLRGVIDFIKQTPALTSEEARELGYAFFRMSTDELLANTSEILRPVCDQAMGLFREEIFRGRQSEFEQFYYG